MKKSIFLVFVMMSPFVSLFAQDSEVIQCDYTYKRTCGWVNQEQINRLPDCIATRNTSAPGGSCFCNPPACETGDNSLGRDCYATGTGRKGTGAPFWTGVCVRTCKGTSEAPAP